MNGPHTRYARVIQAAITAVMALMSDTTTQFLFTSVLAMLVILIVPAIIWRKNG